MWIKKRSLFLLLFWNSFRAAADISIDFGDRGTNDCPEGYSKITDHLSCIAAFGLVRPFLAKRKMETSSVENDSAPSGCFAFPEIEGTVEVAFNTHPTGGAAEDLRPVCQLNSWERRTGGVLYVGETVVEEWSDNYFTKANLPKFSDGRYMDNQYNVGIRGYTCESVLETIGPWLEFFQPEWVVLVCGKIDILEGASSELTFQRLEEVVQKIDEYAAQSASVYMGTIYMGTMKSESTYRDYDYRAQTLAVENSMLAFVDVYESFYDRALASGRRVVYPIYDQFIKDIYIWSDWNLWVKEIIQSESHDCRSWRARYGDEQEFQCTHDQNGITPFGSLFGPLEPPPEIAKGSSVLYVGNSDVKNWINLPPPPATMVNKNVGSDGYTCERVSEMIGLWLELYTPSIVVLVCGEDDILEGAGSNLAFQHLEGVVQTIHEYGAVTLYLGAKLGPETFDFWDELRAYNYRAQTLAVEKCTFGFVDVHESFEDLALLGNRLDMYSGNGLSEEGYSYWNAWITEYIDDQGWINCCSWRALYSFMPYMDNGSWKDFQCTYDSWNGITEFGMLFGPLEPPPELPSESQNTPTVSTGSVIGDAFDSVASNFGNSQSVDGDSNIQTIGDDDTEIDSTAGGAGKAGEGLAVAILISGIFFGQAW